MSPALVSRRTDILAAHNRVLRNEVQRRDWWMEDAMGLSWCSERTRFLPKLQRWIFCLT